MSTENRQNDTPQWPAPSPVTLQARCELDRVLLAELGEPWSYLAGGDSSAGILAHGPYEVVIRYVSNDRPSLVIPQLSCFFDPASAEIANQRPWRGPRCPERLGTFDNTEDLRAAVAAHIEKGLG